MLFKPGYYRFILLIIMTGVLQAVNGQQANKPNAQTQPGSINAALVHTPAQYGSGIKVNFVRTKQAMGRYLDPVPFNAAGYADVSQTTQYLDGLGKPFQTVSREASPGASPKDMVTPLELDAYGREVYSYIPYVQTTGTNTNNGSFKTNPFNDQVNFYTSVYKDANDQVMLAGEQIFYKKTVYEASPLNRVKKTFAPGNSWAGSEGSSSEHAITLDYMVNTESDDAVRIWTIGNNALAYSNNDVTINIPSTNAVYGTGELYKIVSKDESGNVTVDYKDKLGRLLLQKKQSGQIESDYSGYGGFLCTYYVYDDFGQLRFVIQPRGVEQLLLNNWQLQGETDILNEVCYRYEYDAQQREVAAKIPGAGWVYTVYDKRNRAVFSQDANMRVNDQWLATLYDGQDRPVLTGMITYSGNRDALQLYADQNGGGGTTTVTVTYPGPYALQISQRVQGISQYIARNSITFTDGFVSEPTAEFEALIDPNFNIGTENINVTLNPIPPGGNLAVLTVNYYDDYSWTNKTYITAYNSQLDAGNNQHAETMPSLSEQQAISTKGLLTGSKARVIENPANLADGAFLTSVNFYDDRGRLLQLQSDNYKGGTDITANRYNFSGKAVSSYMEHNNPAGTLGPVKVKTNMEYDAHGRVVEIWKTINDEPAKKALLSKNEYDEMGQVKKKDLGRKKDASGNYTTTPLEALLYNYNVQGWLQGINKDYANAQSSGNNRWFGMELNYDWGFDAGQFNRNLAGTKWRSKGNGERRAYGFTYDNVNRIMGADFSQSNGSNYLDNATVNFDMVMGNGVNAGLAYDANGNILAMKQWGMKISGSEPIDQMSYEYMKKGNRLQMIKDEANDPQSKLGDFNYRSSLSKDPVATVYPTDYTYDVNGNLISDINKNISSIVYNHLNQPAEVTIKSDDGLSNRGIITYVYDALGNKLEKRIVDYTNNQQSGKSITYFDSYMYEDNKLQSFAHEEGRVRYIPADGVVPEKFEYDYFVKDHLGNIRMVLSEEQRKDLYQAGMEEAKRQFEVALFGQKINTTNQDKPGGFDSDGDNDKVSAVSGSTAEGRVGPGVILKVMAGDKIKALTHAWYQNTGMDNSTQDGLPAMALNLLGQLTPAVNGIGKGTRAEQFTNGILQPGMENFLGTRSPQQNAPKAFLNWVLLDEEQLQYVAASSNFVAVPEITDVQQKQLLLANGGNEIEMTKNGYLYVFVSNESKGNVYFDDIRVDHIKGSLIEETHYYPFGLTMEGISSKAFGPLENKRKRFQGQELASKELYDGSGLDMYEFKWRMHSPQIGRFWQADPLADRYVHNSTYAFSENKVTIHVELEGLEAEYIFGRFRNAIKEEFVNFGNQIDRFFSVNDKRSVSTETLKTPVMTQSVGYTTTTTTSSNLGNFMRYLTYHNTLDGYKGPFLKSKQTSTVDFKTELKAGKVTIVNKTSIDIRTGEVTNETGGKGTINVRGVDVGAEGSAGRSSEGNRKATGKLSTGFGDAKVLVEGSATNTTKQTTMTFNFGFEYKAGRTTVTQSYGFGFTFW